MQSVDSYRAERQWQSARARPGRPNIEFCYQRIPSAEPLGIPAATQQSVGGRDDGGALVHQLSLGKAESLPVRLDQPPVAGQITPLNVRFSVHAAVELMQPVCADDPQVTTGDKATPVVEDLMLRLDWDVSG
jgi:hypothetical protein